MVLFLTPQEKDKLRMVVNVCVCICQTKKMERDCLQPNYLFSLLYRGTTGWILHDLIMVKVSFLSVRFSVSLVDLFMFGIPQRPYRVRQKLWLILAF